MEKTRNIGLIGYGGMGGWHAKLIRKIPMLHLKGIYDIDSLRMEKAKEDGIDTYETLDEMLKDDEIELVVLAIPNDVHKEVAIKAMNFKKNVVCEKPVCLNSSELEEMISASKENDVIFTVHQNRRWDEDYLTVKKIFDENMLGKIFNIESRVQGSRGIPGDWRNQKKYGGGMVLDWGVHLLDQILMMVDDDLDTVYATLSNVTNEEVDDGFKTILTFKSGLTCHVEVGTSNFISLPRWYVLGENGTAVIENFGCEGKIVKVSDWEKRDAVPVVTAAGLTKTMAPRTKDTIKTYPLPEITSDIRDYYLNVFAAIDKKEPIIVTHDHQRNVMKLMETVFVSANENRIVKY